MGTVNNYKKKLLGQNKDVAHFSKFKRSNKNKEKNQMITNSKNWDTSLSTQTAHYDHIKGSSKRQIF